MRIVWIVIMAGCSGDVTESLEAAGASVARCVYENPFSRTPECREYVGAAWALDRAERDCVRMWNGTLTANEQCAYTSVLGRCEVDAGSDDELKIVFPGTDLSACESTQTGCEVFAGGQFEPDICDGRAPQPPASMSVFAPPTLSCVDPVPGDAPAGLDAKVCTWSAISACTEPGRRFADYGSCETVRTQRPYYPVSVAPLPEIPMDNRDADADYLAELEWVRSQVEACACVCCHSEELAPSGPANWFVEYEPLWVDSFADSGLALGAGWVESTAFGAYPPTDNNGFDRSVSGFPTTEPARMVAFFEEELARRGRVRADFADTPPFGGPLNDQLTYEPSACDEGVGLVDGRLSWTGAIRYLYVLEAGSDNPLVPPNLDLPEGTLWRLDVAPSDEPLQDPVMYGEVPDGAEQRFPLEGRPALLVSGNRYYLYAIADVGVPRTRCLFVAP